MNQEIKRKWIEEMSSGKYRHVAHCIRCGDMYDAIGILCLMHSVETGNEWNGNMYMNNYISAPATVLEWAGLTASQQSIIITKNGEFDDGLKRSYQSVIEYVETL